MTHIRPKVSPNDSGQMSRCCRKHDRVTGWWSPVWWRYSFHPGRFRHGSPWRTPVRTDHRLWVTRSNTALEKDVEARVVEPISRGQKMATVSVNAGYAETFLAKDRIKVGRASCRMRTRLLVPMCLKCVGFGQVAAKCTFRDRRKFCWNYGKDSFKLSPPCFLYSSSGA